MTDSDMILTLEKLGAFCAKHACKTCIVDKLCREQKHRCPIGLRVPSVAMAVAKCIRNEEAKGFRKGKLHEKDAGEEAQ